MSPLEIAAVLLQLLKSFGAAGKTPDEPATDAELQAASAAAHVASDSLQALIDAKKAKP